MALVRISRTNGFSCVTSRNELNRNPIIIYYKCVFVETDFSWTGVTPLVSGTTRIFFQTCKVFLKKVDFIYSDLQIFLVRSPGQIEWGGGCVPKDENDGGCIYNDKFIDLDSNQTTFHDSPRVRKFSSDRNKIRLETIAIQRSRDVTYIKKPTIHHLLKEHLFRNTYLSTPTSYA